jgi:hypothetical protein
MTFRYLLGGCGVGRGVESQGQRAIRDIINGDARLFATIVAANVLRIHPSRY